tara:strand:+ start:1285 stop:1479 length:195 start_codon:yes stop_codon:yes gene_type:complete
MATPLEDATWAEYWEAFYSFTRFGSIPLKVNPATGDEFTYRELFDRLPVAMDAYNEARIAAEAE